MADAFDEIFIKLIQRWSYRLMIAMFLMFIPANAKRNVPFVIHQRRRFRDGQCLSRGQLLGYKSASSGSKLSLVRELVEPNFHPSYVQNAKILV